MITSTPFFTGYAMIAASPGGKPPRLMGVRNVPLREQRFVVAYHIVVFVLLPAVVTSIVWLHLWLAA